MHNFKSSLAQPMSAFVAEDSTAVAVPLGMQAGLDDAYGGTIDPRPLPVDDPVSLYSYGLPITGQTNSDNMVNVRTDFQASQDSSVLVSGSYAQGTVSPYCDNISMEQGCLAGIATLAFQGLHLLNAT